MKLYGALILFMTLSTAYGIRCYSCAGTDQNTCTDIMSCPAVFNRCFSLRSEGLNVITKGCQNSITCIDAMNCCEGDLCNSAGPTGPGVLLLLVSSAIVALFL